MSRYLLDTLPAIARAIYDQKPLLHLQRLIREGANVNQEVISYPYHHYVAPLLVFTVYQYQPNGHPSPKLARRFQYLRQVLDLLLEHGADPSCFAPLHDRLLPFLYDDPTLLDSLIAQGLTLHLTDDHRDTLLIQSVKHLRFWIKDPHQVRKRCTIIHQLLDRGVDPALQNGNGCTALHYLLICPLIPDLLPLLRRLVSVTDVRLEDNDGNTPLHNYFVLYKEDPVHPQLPPQQVIELLLAHGADRNARNGKGETPGERRVAAGLAPLPGQE